MFFFKKYIEIIFFYLLKLNKRKETLQPDPTTQRCLVWLQSQTQQAPQKEPHFNIKNHF
jgi:hypothetical protein